MADILKRLSEIGIVPVIALEDAEQAVPLAKALIAGGLPAAEVTFRTEAGEEAIRRIAQACPEIVLGAGTVLTTAQIDEALEAGARFIVSPGLDPELVEYCQSKKVTIFPGCTTPTDYHTAYKYGLEVLNEHISNSTTNTTRFIVVTAKKQYRADAKKVSICFEIQHESGSLYNMLSHMIYNNLNMTKIESRPLPDRPFEYRFFVDFEGNLSDPAVENALLGIREEAQNLKILGNY